MRQDFYEEYTRIEREHWWFIARRKILLTILRRFVPLPNTLCSVSVARHPLVLDIGIGSGVMLEQLGEFGEVIGCDRERAALSFSFPNAAGRIIQGEAEHLPFRSETLDLITLFDLLEHTTEDQTVLCDVARVLRPGGFLCVTVPVHQWLWGNQDIISRHVRRYRLGELECKVNRAGLRILYRTYFNTFLFPVVVFVRLCKRCGEMFGGDSWKLDPDRVRSDFSMTKPGRLNDFLAWVFSQEARWLRFSRFPVGVSLLCLVQKPNRDSSSTPVLIQHD